MNNGLTFGDWFLLWLGTTIFCAVLMYFSGMWTPDDTSQLMGIIHSLPAYVHQTSHDAHVARQALGASAQDWNYVMQGHPIIPPAVGQ